MTSSCSGFPPRSAFRPPSWLSSDPQKNSRTEPTSLSKCSQEKMPDRKIAAALVKIAQTRLTPQNPPRLLMPELTLTPANPLAQSLRSSPTNVEPAASTSPTILQMLTSSSPSSSPTSLP